MIFAQKLCASVGVQVSQNANPATATNGQAATSAPAPSPSTSAAATSSMVTSTTSSAPATPTCNSTGNSTVEPFTGAANVNFANDFAAVMWAIGLVAAMMVAA